MSWLGLDIGGANLKAADGRGWARSVPFSMFDRADSLAEELADLLAAAPECARLAVTMTGELSGGFRTKAEGVRHILAAAEHVAANRDLRAYLVDGRLVPVEVAAEFPQLAAASNWHALARFACRFMRGRAGLVIDVGSTTTDIIPAADGTLRNRGMNDTERLLSRELVYTGVVHTPICAVAPLLPWRGRECPVASEFFAATADAYILLGEIAECPDADWTTDGQPLTREFARARLGSMLCADTSMFSDDDALRAAEFVRETQLGQLRVAATEVASRFQAGAEVAIIAGVGEFLARRLVKDVWPRCEIVSLADEFGAMASACAPAHALAVLAWESESR